MLACKSALNLGKKANNLSNYAFNINIKLVFCSSVNPQEYKCRCAASLQNMDQSVMWHRLTVPLTARLISISSKSLWSSMAATSQRYSAVSERVVLKIRMLAGSLSWALCSKSPFKRGKKHFTIAHSHTQRDFTAQRNRIQCQVLSR